MTGLQLGEYVLGFETGGISVSRDGQELYFNRRPVYVFVKTALSITEFYDGPYLSVTERDGQVVAEGVLTTPTGTVLAVRDVYETAPSGFKVSRNVTVQNTIDDLGFATKFALVLAESDDIRAYDYFAPAAWYRQNEYTRPDIMGHDLDGEYFWRREVNYALPLFAAQSRSTGETVCLSRWAADVVMRNHDFVQSEHIVDRVFNIGSIGISRPESRTLNYLYYGFPLRKDIVTRRDGLTIDYVYPGVDGECARMGRGYNVDYMMNTRTMTRMYHPAEEGYEQRYSVMVDLARHDGFYSMLRSTWRSAYARLRDGLYDVDNETHFHNCMRLLTKLTRQYDHDSWGLPFSCQLPDMDVSSVSFQFGFVGQQPGIGYQLIRYGDMEGVEESYQKGLHIIDFWVRVAMTDTGAPNVCYNPAIDGFEPYPHWTRMIADGLENILDAYVYLRKKGIRKEKWFQFCRKAADWLVGIQNDDGSYYRAYNSDSSMRMDSKANTVCVVRFLIQFHLVDGDERYRQAALRAGEWAYANTYKGLEYRGSTCDNSDILDNESGIYAMFGFLSLYDLTGEDRWLEALKGAADFTETWTYAWSYPVRTLWPKHPFNTHGISGQSSVTIGGGGGDVYMAACAYIYFRLYVLTGDEHYADFAEFIHNNTRQSNDVDGSVGYIMPGLGHEGGHFASQTLMSHYHWLPWCTYVEVDPTSRLFDTFGAYTIADAMKLGHSELEARNRIYDDYATFSESV
jgi:hypothetical protein